MLEHVAVDLVQLGVLVLDIWNIIVFTQELELAELLVNPKRSRFDNGLLSRNEFLSTLRI